MKKTSRFAGLQYPVQLAFSPEWIEMGAVVAKALDDFCSDITASFHADGSHICVPSTPEHATLKGAASICIAVRQNQQKTWTNDLDDEITPPISLYEMAVDSSREEAWYLAQEGTRHPMHKALIRSAESIEKTALQLRDLAETMR